MRFLVKVNIPVGLAIRPQEPANSAQPSNPYWRI